MKNMMPRSTVPTAPMPVHTGYAVPIGRLWTAFASRIMLNDRQIMKPAPHNHHAVPETSFIFPRQNANPDSNIPATISIIQFIIVLHSCLQIYIKYFCRQSRRHQYHGPFPEFFHAILVLNVPRQIAVRALVCNRRLCSNHNFFCPNSKIVIFIIRVRMTGAGGQI